MKNTTFVILVVLGIVLIGTGILMGADLSYRMFSFSSFYPDFIQGVVHHPDQGKKAEKVEFSTQEKVELTVPLGEIYVLPSEDENIHIDYQTEGTTWSQELVIDKQKEKLVLGFRVKNKAVISKAPYTRLYLPKGVKSLTLTAHAGEVELRDLKDLLVSVEANMGSVEIKNSHLKGDITLNMGSLELKDVTLENTTTDLNMGSMEGKVKFIGKNSIETNMGSVELELLQDAKEVYLELNASLGSVNAVQGGEKEKAKAELKVNASVGSITIKED